MRKEVTIEYDDHVNTIWLTTEVPEVGEFLDCDNLQHATSFSIPLDEITPHLRVLKMGGFWMNRYINDSTLGNLKVHLENDPYGQQVDNLAYFFRDSIYNHPLDKWDVRNVNTMYYMFYNSAFHQDLGMWNVRPNCWCNGMFYRSRFTIEEVKNWKWVKNLDIPVEQLFKATPM